MRPTRRGHGARPRAWLAATVTVPLLAGLWFVLTARTVTIEVEPLAEPVSVSVRGGLSLPIGERRLMRPGRWVVLAEHPGYRPLEQAIEVPPDRDPTFRFTLAPLPGKLRVTSTPPGASVVVDGEPSGATPLDALELEPGRHRVVVRAPRHVPHEAELEIEGRGLLQTLDVALVPAWAPVAFRSEPAGALLEVDGEAVGRTPLTAELAAGEREVRLSLEGHEPWSEAIAVVAGEAREVPLVRLARARGRLRLTSSPAGANVTVDGEFRGRTPLTLALAPEEPAAIALARAGYEPTKREVSVGSGEERELAVALVPILGTVRVRATPADALLVVDGEPRGAASQDLELTAAPHRIEIRKPGYASHETTVTPKPGFAQEIAVTLLAEAEAEVAALPREIRSPNGELLRLVPRGAFTMGSPRREQGRRANEIERRVRLTRPFYLGVHEVTNGAFRAFRAAHSSGIVARETLDDDRMPVVRVSWQDAVAYCNWLSERAGLPPAYRGEELVTPVGPGFRLPSEAEWAYAARFGGGRDLKYPWGPHMPPGADAGNYADRSAASIVAEHLREYDDGFAAAAPVGRYAPSALGFFDLGGNVAEWVHDRYGTAPGAPVEVDPFGPTTGGARVVRGSSWRHGRIPELRLAHREAVSGVRDDVGFRIARSAE